MTETARGAHGVVASGHPLATEAGLAVLQGGGNATDAAVAAALMLTVVCPYATSLGGDVYMLIRDPETGAVHGLNGTGSAPDRATLDAFDGDIPPSGYGAVSVPGFLAGIAEALDRFGTRRLASLIAPVQEIASEGFPVHATLAANIARRHELLAGDPDAAALFLPDGAPLAEGATLRQPALAASLAAIARDGIDAFYEGGIAARIAADSAVRGGLIAAADFAAHRTIWQEPVAAPFCGHEVLTMPPNSFGLTLLFQLLDLAANGVGGLDPDGAEFLLAVIGARRRAYRAAAGLIGDPVALEAPARARLAEAVAAGRLDTGPMSAPEARDTDTTNVVAVDRDGGAVSLIQSISAPFGAGVVAAGTGIVLNNRMRGFVVDPASPNCVGPGKRPAHTLSPCLVLKDGGLAMSVGTPGAGGQTCTLAQFLARTLACGRPVAEAIAAPRASVDLKGQPIVEKRLSEDMLAVLQAREPALRAMPRGWQTFGSLKVAGVDADGGLHGWADDRREASVAAF